MKYVGFVVLTGFLLPLTSATAAEPQTPTKIAVSNGKTWSENAVADLTEIRSLIRANHPGPVDPKNPQYRVWLERGFNEALRLARRAQTRADYQRALLLYTNGFRDGHIGWGFVDDPSFQWPGFLTSTAADGSTVVVDAEPDASVVVGSRLVSCDETTPAKLLDDRVHRFRTNADIPQERRWHAPRLFYALADDDRLLRQCKFEAKGVERSVSLRWRPVARDRLDKALDIARASVTPTLGVKEVEGVWFVSIPTFNADGQQMQGLIQAIKAHAQTLHRASAVVVDVRGNGGGNSTWGEEAAVALWGKPMVTAISDSFDWTTDWRVSRENIDLTREMGRRAVSDGAQSSADYRFRIAASLEKALASGQELYRDNEPPKANGLPAGAASPFSGKIFLLTDNRCASACLDFADIVTRMPAVIHIGEPTSADAVYIDLVTKRLASGIADFDWSVKVYRNRIRSNNQWYEPKVRWSGGAMTDQAVANWVKRL